MENYVFLLNNAYESLNYLINSLIVIYHNFSVSRFEIIIKTFFIKMDAINSQNQNLDYLERKRQLSDIIMDLIKCGYGKKGLLTEKEFKFINNYKNEKEIFNF